MKKTNFLKGVCAKLALAVVAFGAMVTSCTKEEFNVNYEANVAKIYFAPTVIDAATNTVVLDAAITGADEISGDQNNKDIKAGSVTITATKNGVTGSTTVQYGAVPAGSVATYSPVILLSSEFELKNEVATEVSTREIYGQGEEGHDGHDGNIYNSNASDYFMPFTTTFAFPGEIKDVELNASVTSVELNNYVEALEGTATSAEATFTDKASAWSFYTAKAIITTAEISADVVSLATGAKVGTVTYENTAYKAEIQKYEIAHPSHAGHYQHGHGHGDSTNAGGGITWAE